jgi:hypothetical protein
MVGYANFATKSLAEHRSHCNLQVTNCQSRGWLLWVALRAVLLQCSQSGDISGLCTPDPDHSVS